MKIFAVGMNYIQHNKELDGALYKPEQPVIFTKADSALLKNLSSFPIGANRWIMRQNWWCVSADWERAYLSDSLIATMMQ